MRDAIIMSTWSWDMFNVPERVALALASRGARVLYCEMPASHFRRVRKVEEKVSAGIRRFRPGYLGAKFTSVPGMGTFQWKMVAKQITARAIALKLDNPLFIYSHIDRMTPLCREMKAAGFPLVHICMDYPEPYQYELVAVSDQTLVIPKSVFHKLKSKFGDKIQWIPQSIHLPASGLDPETSSSEPAALSRVPRPRLGYLGPILGRLNLDLLKTVLTAHPEWQFLHFGEPGDLHLSNVHSVKWLRADELPSYTSALDVGVMPYDCFEEKNLHCVPLKLFDYFLAGLPVVATPVLSLAEFPGLIYFGETAVEFSHAVSCALEESLTDPKRKLRQQVARAHSTEALGLRLEEVLPRRLHRVTL